MRTILLFAKISLTVVAIYAYMLFAFVDALKGLNYPKPETLEYVNNQPQSEKILVEKVMQKQILGNERAGLSY